jgi:pimeloyl-ACP methyl ester carboxylesterase
MKEPGPDSIQRNSTPVRNYRLSALRLGFGLLERTSPALAAAAGEVLFRTPPRRRRDPDMEAILATARRGQLRVMGADVATWSWGEGPAILLAHGWGSRGGRLAAFVAPLVSRGFSVTTWDAPGHGASQGRLSSLIQFAAAAREAARTAGEVHGVVAHSLGCAASVLAMQQGVEARRAVFLAPPANPTPFAVEMAKALGLSDRTLREMKARIERRFSFRWDDLDVPTVAPRMTSRLLVFHDRADREVPFEHGAAIAAAWPGAQLISTHGLGHKRIVAEPWIVRDAAEFVTAGAEARPAARAARG